MNLKQIKFLALTALLALLLGCGGTAPDSSPTPQKTNNGNGNNNGGNPPPYNGGTYTGGTVPPATVGATIVDITVEDTSGADQSAIPITFGQVFKPGQIPAGTLLGLRLKNGTQALIPSQIDKKATHADGSLRHAVITARIPTLAANSPQDVEIVVVDSVPTTQSVQLADLLTTNFDGVVSLDVAGTTYTVSIADLLNNAQTKTWLSGPEVTEWMVSAPLKSADGTEHPHLTARFNVRAYASFDSVRVDVVIENDWAYVPNPRNFVYDVNISLCGNNVYSKTGLTHYHHARWRKTFWCGKEPAIHIKHNIAYILDSYAVPNYDRSLVIPEADLASMEARWMGSKTEPMGIGFANEYMPATGAAAGIGPNPRWVTRYLLSQDVRAKTATLGTANLAGSWSIHYRDKTTNLPILLTDFPYMTIKGRYNDTKNRSTGNYEAFPSCSGNCSTPYTADDAHQPALAYVPYLISGDHYLLEELQFWANYNMFQSNPYYREFEQGLFNHGQVRAQAWSMRTLGETAYITPDNDPLKDYFVERVQFNLDWYNNNYVKNTPPNMLGFIQNGYSIVYSDGRGVAPWQDDFFTWSIGYLVELGFYNAEQLFAWKAKFPINRMTNTDFCWIFASNYSLLVRDNPSNPIYSTWAKIYTSNIDASLTSLVCDSQQMATLRNAQVGEMIGYASSPIGYAANLQPALAVSAKLSTPNGLNAWNKFYDRPIKPDYSTYPNFSIIPRER